MVVMLRNRPVRWALGFLGWTLIGLFYSTKTGMGGRPVAFVESLKYSLTYWYVWGLLTPVIILVDRRLPAPRDNSNLGAAGCEPRRDSEPDALASAGDHGRPAGEIDVHGVPPNRR